MPRLTIKFLQAQLEARDAEIIGLRDELDTLRRRQATLRSDERAIASRVELRAKCIALARRGVPCFMRGDFIYHSQTKAVLAQVHHATS